MLTCAPQYDNNTTVESAHGRYNAPKTWLIVNTTFTYSYYERLHTDYLDKRNLPKLIIRLVLSILPHLTHLTCTADTPPSGSLH